MVPNRSHGSSQVPAVCARSLRKRRSIGSPSREHGLIRGAVLLLEFLLLAGAGSAWLLLASRSAQPLRWRCRPRLRYVGMAACSSEEVTDGSWTPPEKVYSNFIRSLPGSGLSQEDRKILPLGKAVLRRKAKLVKPERIGLNKSQAVLEEVLRVMRGPNLPGRQFKGGFLTAPQLGTPSRLVVMEDPAVAVEQLSPEERIVESRESPFGPKAIFNPRLKPVSADTMVSWEKDSSIPGYRALVQRPFSVQVDGFDPEGRRVNYVASGQEARLLQQAVDVLDGIMFIDRCVTQSLRHLDARSDPLPLICPSLGVHKESAKGAAKPEFSEEELDAIAEKGGSRGFLGGLSLPFGQPSVLLIGSLLLRLPAKEVNPASPDVADASRELRDAVASGEHPLGLAAPQLGRRLRMIAIGETEDAIAKLPVRAQVSEEHRAFGPLVLLNPVVRPKPGSFDTYFFEQSASVPGYEAVVKRAQEVNVEAFDERGQKVSFTAKGWQARQLQHAADILDGILYVDRMERRSFRRDKVDDELPEDVPFGVRKPAGPTREAKRKKISSAKAQSNTRTASKSARSGGRSRRQ